MFSGLISLFFVKSKKGVLACGLLMAALALTHIPAYGQYLDPTGLQPAALNFTGTFSLRQNDPNLTGEGVTIAAVCRSMTYLQGQPQNDYGLNIDHKCFSQGSINFVDGHNIEEGVSEHATAIGAILIGQDPNAYHPQIGSFAFQSAAPGATLDVHEFWRFVVNYVYGPEELKADILTLSVGTTFQDWWTRGIQRLVEKDGLLVVAGIGNGSNVFDPVLYPAAGANVIGVGVVDSVRCAALSKSLSEFSLPRVEHSSCGPTNDKRCKPDIVAPGNCLVPSASGNTKYDSTGDWSSFATPIVSGTTALLVQKAKNDPELAQAISPQGGNCVMKAILMNSATKLPFWHKGDIGKEDDHQVPLDHIQGAGLLNAPRAYHHLVAGQAASDVSNTGWDNNVISNRQNTENAYRFKLTQTQPNEFITVTLAWNRHFQEQYPFDPSPEKDNNLRLELWAVNPDDTLQNYMIDHSNSINDNIEHIYCPVDPNFTTYEIIVTCSDFIDTNSHDIDISQRYGIAWNITREDTDKSTWWYDLNGDNNIDSMDFGILLENFNRSAETDEGYLLGDINMDARIDVNDMLILVEKLGDQK